MIALGIETSCDETSVAVVRDGVEILSNLIASQVDIHALTGGVVPEVAARKHVERLTPIIEEALRRANVSFTDIDLIAVTNRPGLVGALMVGVSAGKALAYALGKPIVAVHHLEGHIASNFLTAPDLQFPFVCLIVSGGHTDLHIVEGHGKRRRLGSTRDDAAGEAFDKAARLLGLGYPGGPAIDRKAKEGNPQAIAFPTCVAGGRQLRLQLQRAEDCAVASGAAGGRHAERRRCRRQLSGSHCGRAGAEDHPRGGGVWHPAHRGVRGSGGELAPESGNERGSGQTRLPAGHPAADSVH
jgi:tRNA A37 threonylcarbamoyltransferase TsaD